MKVYYQHHLFIGKVQFVLKLLQVILRSLFELIDAITVCENSVNCMQKRKSALSI